MRWGQGEGEEEKNKIQRPAEVKADLFHILLIQKLKPP